MHCVNKRTGVLGRDLRVDTVTEIEHMAVATTIALQHLAHLVANLVGWAVQHARIHVALQRDPVANTRPRIGQIGGPVDTQRITATIGNRFQPLPTALGKQHHRHLAAIGLALQSVDDAAHIIQREALVALR